jgi:hypothetical protein
VRLRFVWLRRPHCGQCSLPVAVAHLVLVRRMWRHSLLALVLGYAVAGTAWIFAYGPGRQASWISHSSPLAIGLGFGAALLIALGFWILASVGSVLAIARDEASRTLAGFFVFVVSTLSTATLVILGCYHVL